MFRHHSQKILIVGAGIAGLALARACKRQHIPFFLIEKRLNLTTDGAGIALPANAVHALRYLKLGAGVDKKSHQVEKIIYTDTLGATLSSASLLEPPLHLDRFVALPRHRFHEVMSEGLDDQIYFNTTVKQMTEQNEGVLVTFNSPQLQPELFSAVVGADGIHSQVRELSFPNAKIEDLGVTIWRWTCHYPTKNLQPIYFMGYRQIFMVYPIGENEVYCYAHVFDPENVIAKSSDHQRNLRNQFGQYGGIAKIMLDSLPDNSHIIPGRLRSVAKPLFATGRIALIGDAGHGCSPMLQQGAAAALEDVIALSQFLKYFSTQDALVHYENFRSERVNWISTASDGPMKMLINFDQQQFAMLVQKIRDNGPLNIQGWRKLLATDYLSDLQTYLDKHQELKPELPTARL